MNEYFCVSAGPKVPKRILACNQWQAFAAVTNALHDLENSDCLMDVKEGEILDSMQRLAWHQFPWQVGFRSAANMYRAWFLYYFEDADNHFRSSHGISINEFTLAGFAAFASLSDFPAIRSDLNMTSVGVGREDLHSLIKIVSNRSTGISAEAQKIRSWKVPTAYRASVLRKWPGIIISRNDHSEIFFPIPELLLHRITDGLYYDLVSNSNVRRIIGEKFEE